MASLLVNWFGLSIDFVANAFRSLYNSTITPPPQSLPQLSQPLQFPMRNNKRSRKFAQTKANTRKHNCGKRVLRLDCLEKRYAFNVDWGLSYHNEAFPVDTNLDGVFSELDVIQMGKAIDFSPALIFPLAHVTDRSSIRRSLALKLMVERKSR